MKRNYWFPNSRPKQRLLFANVKSKIGGYESILPLPSAKVERITLICDTFLTVNDFVEQVRATAQGLTDWQNLIYDGSPETTTGSPAPDAPVFKNVTLPSGAFVGIFEEFKALVDDIKHADNYTEAIGEDLMLVGEESAELVLDELVAELKKVQPAAGYEINLDASLQGASAVRVEYWEKSATAPQVDKFTKFPARMTIYPKNPGAPETGHLRAFLLKDNEEIGQPSPDYPVTLAA